MDSRVPDGSRGRTLDAHSFARVAIRAAALAVLLVVAVNVSLFFIVLATGEELEGALHDLAVIATFGAIVAAGVISGLVAASFARSSTHGDGPPPSRRSC